MLKACKIRFDWHIIWVGFFQPRLPILQDILDAIACGWCAARKRWTGISLPRGVHCRLDRRHHHNMHFAMFQYEWLVYPRLSNSRLIDWLVKNEQQAQMVKIKSSMRGYHRQLVVYIAAQNRLHWKECRLILCSWLHVVVFQEWRLIYYPHHYPASPCSIETSESCLCWNKADPWLWMSLFPRRNVGHGEGCVMPGSIKRKPRRWTLDRLPLEIGKSGLKARLCSTYCFI